MIWSLPNSPTPSITAPWELHADFLVCLSHHSNSAHAVPIAGNGSFDPYTPLDPPFLSSGVASFFVSPDWSALSSDKLSQPPTHLSPHHADNSTVMCIIVTFIDNPVHPHHSRL